MIATAITLASTTAARVGQLVRLLVSDRPGEVTAAAAAIKRTLASVGVDIHLLAEVTERGLQRLTSAPTSAETVDYASLLRRCWVRRSQLNPRDSAFLNSMRAWEGEPTARQAAWLRDIAERLQVRL